MRVGVYVDGFSLYYGGRGLCGRSMPGWRWLDVKALVHDLVSAHSQWNEAVIETGVFGRWRELAPALKGEASAAIG